MALRIDCPQCNSQYSVSERLEGKAFRCKSCGATIRIGDARSQPPGQAEIPASQRDAGAVAPRGRPLGIAIGLIVILLGFPLLTLCIGGGIGLYWLLSIPSPEVEPVQIVAAPPSVAIPRPIDSADPPRSPSPPPVGNPEERIEPDGAIVAEGVPQIFRPHPPARMSRVPAPQGTLQKNDSLPSPVPTLWLVKPDPPADAGTLPADQRILIAIPGEQPFRFPATSSLFVVVGQNRQREDQRQVWSLKENKPVGTLSGALQIGEPVALGPDGAHLAARSRQRDSSAIDLLAFDSRGGRQVGQVTLKAEPFDIDFMEFAGPRVLVTVTRLRDVCTCQTWDVPSGALRKELTLPPTFDKRWAALSPGGKYLSVIDDQRLRVFDLTAGESAGEVGFPSRPGFERLGGMGLAWSRDGTELAGLFHTGLVAWNASTGIVSAYHQYHRAIPDSGIFTLQGGAIEWLPDKSGWLARGSTLVDYQSGGCFFTLPMPAAETGVRARRLLDSDHLLVTVTRNSQTVIESVVLPKDEMAAALVAARGTDQTNSAKLPVLEADWSATRIVSIPSVAGTWSVKLEEIPAPAQPAVRSLPLFGRAADIDKVLFSRGEPRQAVAVSITQPNSLSDKKLVRLVLYGLGLGVQESTLDLITTGVWTAGKPELLADLSRDGKTIAVRNLENHGRVDIWSLPDGKHVASWLPYGQSLTKGTGQGISNQLPPEAARLISQFMQSQPTKTGRAVAGEPNDIVWLAMLDRARLLTVNTSGTLVLWDVATAKAVYAVPHLTKDPRTLCLSPGGKYLAAFYDRTWDVLDTSTGELRGRTVAPAGYPASSAGAAGFSPDGRGLAGVLVGTVVNGVTIPYLVQWDFATGKIISSFPARAASEVHWCGPNHVLLNNEWLADLKSKMVVCNYRLPAGGRHVPRGPDGRHWFATALGDDLTLSSMTLPDETATALTKLVADPGDSTVLKAGMKVSLRFNFSTPDTGHDFQALLRKGLTARLRALDITVADNQPLVLWVQGSEGQTGENMELRSLRPSFPRPGSNFGPTFGPKGARGDPFDEGNETVPVKRLTAQMGFSDNRGTAWWWKTETELSTRLIGMLNVGDGDSSQSALDRELWGGFTLWAANADLPSLLVRQGNSVVVVPGEATLQAD